MRFLILAMLELRWMPCGGSRPKFDLAQIWRKPSKGSHQCANIGTSGNERENKNPRKSMTYGDRCLVGGARFELATPAV
jgi:hypothetical protein